MHRRPFASNVTPWIVVAQLGCVLVGAALLLQLWRSQRSPIVSALLVVCTVAAAITVAGWVTLNEQRRAAVELAKNMAQERKLTATLERAVMARTNELEDAQRVLQRMWWLGQQITLELNPQRVLERFLEAVADIAHAEGGMVGLIGDDGKIRIVVGTGIGAGLTGLAVPISGSAMGRVIRTGTSWTVADINENRDELDEALFDRVTDQMKGVAIVPIARRGERIGAVIMGTKTAGSFSTADLERIEAMGDLLSVSLENA